jgi:hypothetical protein
MRAAPRIDPRLLRLIDLHVGETAAEVTRAIGGRAEELGLARPSYEQVRVWLRQAELERGQVTSADVLLDIALRTRPAYDLPNRLYGDPLPWRPGAKNEPRRA